MWRHCSQFCQTSHSLYLISDTNPWKDIQLTIWKRKEWKHLFPRLHRTWVFSQRRKKNPIKENMNLIIFSFLFPFSISFFFSYKVQDSTLLTSGHDEWRQNQTDFKALYSAKGKLSTRWWGLLKKASMHLFLKMGGHNQEFIKKEFGGVCTALGTNSQFSGVWCLSGSQLSGSWDRRIISSTSSVQCIHTYRDKGEDVYLGSHFQTAAVHHWGKPAGWSSWWWESVASCYQLGNIWEAESSQCQG